MQVPWISTEDAVNTIDNNFLLIKASISLKIQLLSYENVETIFISDFATESHGIMIS